MRLLATAFMFFLSFDALAMSKPHVIITGDCPPNVEQEIRFNNSLAPEYRRFWNDDTYKAEKNLIESSNIIDAVGVSTFFKLVYFFGGDIELIKMNSCKKMSDGTFIDSGSLTVNFHGTPFKHLSGPIRCNDYEAKWKYDFFGRLQVAEDMVLKTQHNCN